jgi:hypothetical protein
MLTSVKAIFYPEYKITWRPSERYKKKSNFKFALMAVFVKKIIDLCVNLFAIAGIIL